MQRNCNIIIVRNFQIRVSACRSGSGIGRNHQKTCLLIGGVDGTNGVHKILIQLVDHFIAFRIALPLIGSASLPRLIHTFEDQMLVVILKVGGDLCPHLLQTLGHLVISVREIGTIDPFLVVQVQNDMHALIVGIVHNFLNTLHPLLIDGVNRLAVFIGSCGDVLIPRGRNSNGVEPLCLDSIDQFLCDFGIAPAGFTVSGGVQRVTNVPADGHVFCDVLSRHSSLSGTGCREKCHAGKQHYCGSAGGKPFASLKLHNYPP